MLLYLIKQRQSATHPEHFIESIYLGKGLICVLQCDTVWVAVYVDVKRLLLELCFHFVFATVVGTVCHAQTSSFLSVLHLKIQFAARFCSSFEAKTSPYFKRAVNIQRPQLERLFGSMC